MCDRIHYGVVEGLVSVERWSCNRGDSCVVEYTMGAERLVSVGRRSCSRGASCVLEYTTGWCTTHPAEGMYKLSLTRGADVLW